MLRILWSDGLLKFEFNATFLLYHSTRREEHFTTPTCLAANCTLHDINLFY